jgi:hypothetical protein
LLKQLCLCSKLLLQIIVRCIAICGCCDIFGLYNLVFCNFNRCFYVLLHTRLPFLPIKCLMILKEVMVLFGVKPGVETSHYLDKVESLINSPWIFISCIDCCVPSDCSKSYGSNCKKT